MLSYLHTFDRIFRTFELLHCRKCVPTVKAELCYYNAVLFFQRQYVILDKAVIYDVIAARKAITFCDMRLVINVFLYRFFLNLFGRNKRYRFNIYLALVIAYHSECRVILSLREVKSEIDYLPPPELVRYLLRAVLHVYKVNIALTAYALILNVAVLA